MIIKSDLTADFIFVQKGELSIEFQHSNFDHLESSLDQEGMKNVLAGKNDDC